MSVFMHRTTDSLYTSRLPFHFYPDRPVMPMNSFYHLISGLYMSRLALYRPSLACLVFMDREARLARAKKAVAKLLELLCFGDCFYLHETDIAEDTFLKADFSSEKCEMMQIEQYLNTSTYSSKVMGTYCQWELLTTARNGLFRATKSQGRRDKNSANNKSNSSTIFATNTSHW